MPGTPTVSGVEVANTRSPLTPQASRPAGYRVTPHISKYYDKARF